MGCCCILQIARRVSWGGRWGRKRGKKKKKGKEKEKGERKRKKGKEKEKRGKRETNYAPTPGVNQLNNEY